MLLELLIAMALSSFIMMAMMLGQRNVMNFLTKTRDLMTVNRKVCLLFNQMERDFTSAFIPQHSKPVVNEEEKEASEKKDQKNHNYFVATIQDGLETRIQGKKYQLLDKITFVTTHPLQLFGQHRVRLVRVAYQLHVDKELKKRDRLVYTLIRKETTELENADFKNKDPEEEKTAYTIRSHIVADNIRDVYSECVMPKKEAGENKTESSEQEMITSFV